jgi:YaiO family outer membrane protein
MYRILFLLLVIINVSAPAQTTDDLFISARADALNGEYLKARETARKILIINKNHSDARVLIARTYAWEQKYDSSALEIVHLFKIDSTNIEAIYLKADIAYWTENHALGLEVINKGLLYYPYNQELLLKKAKFLIALERFDEAEDVLTLLASIAPSNKEVKQTLNKIRKYKNRIIAEHTFDYYNEPAKHRWHVSSLQYQRNARWGTYIGKFNVGQNLLNNETYLSNPSYQIEIDAYPLTRRGYIYTNLGVADGDFFPTMRIGLEPYVSFGKTWEYSYGLRYLNYFYNTDISHIFILTGSLSKYFGANWLSLRPYFSIKKNDFSQSYYLFYRHYFNNPDNYVGGAIGSGSAPDETFNKNIYNSLFSLNTYRVRFDFQYKIHKRFLFKSLLGYSLEKYVPSDYRDRFDLTFYLAYLF